MAVELQSGLDIRAPTMEPTHVSPADTEAGWCSELAEVGVTNETAGRWPARASFTIESAGTRLFLCEDPRHS
jgi:hypothetical protein